MKKNSPGGCRCCDVTCSSYAMTSPANTLFEQDALNDKLYTLQRRLPKDLYRLHFQEICDTAYFSPYGWEEGEQDKRITIRLKKVSDDTVFFSLNIYRELGEFVETVSGVDIYKWYLLGEADTGEILRINEVEGRIDRPEGLHFSLPIVELDLPDAFDFLVLQSHIEVDAYYDQDSDLYRYQRVPFSASSEGSKAILEIEYTHDDQPGRFGWHGLPEESKGLKLDCPPVHTCDVLSPYTHVLWEVDSITVPRSRIDEEGTVVTEVTYLNCQASKGFNGSRPEYVNLEYVASTTAGGSPVRYTTTYSVSPLPSDDEVDDGIGAAVSIGIEVIDPEHEDYPEDAVEEEGGGFADMVRVTCGVTLSGAFETAPAVPAAFSPGFTPDPFDSAVTTSVYPPGSPGLGNTRELVRNQTFPFSTSTHAPPELSPIVFKKIVSMFQSTNPPTIIFGSGDIVSGAASGWYLADGYEIIDTGFTDSTTYSPGSEPQDVEWPVLWLQRTYSAYDPTQVAITIKANVEYPA